MSVREKAGLALGGAHYLLGRLLAAGTKVKDATADGVCKALFAARAKEPVILCRYDERVKPELKQMVQLSGNFALINLAQYKGEICLERRTGPAEGQADSGAPSVTAVGG